jgi:hypothetical protein
MRRVEDRRVPVTFSIPQSQHKILRELAEKDGRTVSRMVEILLSSALLQLNDELKRVREDEPWIAL